MIDFTNCKEVICDYSGSEIRKEFLKQSILYRKENILDVYYNKLKG